MRCAHVTTEEQDTGYSQLFLDSLSVLVLMWFSRLKANSLDNFHQSSTEFQKYYSMYIIHRESTTDVLKMTHGPKKGLRAFIQRFKRLVSKVLVLDQTAVEALSNAL